MTSVDNVEWLTTPMNGHPGGKVPEAFIKENPGVQFDHTVVGWQRKYDEPNVVQLRERLDAAGGIPDLELVAPHEVDRAVEIFARDGFVAVKVRSALPPRNLTAFKLRDCTSVAIIVCVRTLSTQSNSLKSRRRQTGSWSRS